MEKKPTRNKIKLNTSGKIKYHPNLFLSMNDKA